MPKTLCEIKKLLKTDINAYVQQVDKPKHLCQSCGRVANDRSLLCKPISMKKLKKATRT